MNKITRKILIEKILLLKKDEIDEFYQTAIPDSHVVEKNIKISSCIH
jgi:hypothetical protein